MVTIYREPLSCVELETGIGDETIKVSHVGSKFTCVVYWLYIAPIIEFQAV